MYSLVIVWGSQATFSVSFSFFEFLQSFLKDLFLLTPVAECPSVGCLFFYSVILGFLGYHWFPLSSLLGTRTNVVSNIVSTTLVAGPFLILHYFPLLRFLIQKPLADFPFWEALERWPLIFPFPRPLDSTFSDPPFGCSPLCHFSQMGWFLSINLKDLQPPSFMVHLPGFPEVPTPHSWVVDSQVFWSFFCIIGWLMGPFSPRSSCF